MTAPDGWLLVPKTPTGDMLYAMAECDGYQRGDRDHPMLTRWEDYWRAAIAKAAAPEITSVPCFEDFFVSRDAFECYAQQMGYRDFEATSEDGILRYNNPGIQTLWCFWTASREALA